MTILDTLKISTRDVFMQVYGEKFATESYQEKNSALGKLDVHPIYDCSS